MYKTDKTIPSDLHTIKLIEKQLNFKLEKLDKITDNSRGYIPDNNKVTGLALYYADLDDISSLKELKNLKELHLSDNPIETLLE
ncbi:MAG: hypothetical protein ACUZ8O_05900 [Candidatus Anammoxibacter sp.]